MSEGATALDRRFLSAAIRLGTSAQGETHPNPAVGVILVKDGCVVGRGHTGKGGRPHAERVALDMAGDQANGATLYVSLEPCAHHGRTPPCTDAIIGAGVKRVVAAISDPDKRVSGAGFQAMREAGIEVLEPLLAEDAAASHAGHFSLMDFGRPYIVLKLAVSADDGVGLVGEVQTPVSSAISRTHVQALRSRFDAILVGSGTVAIDNPSLTVRLPGLEDRSPVRIVLDGSNRLDPDRTIFSDHAAPTIQFIATPLEQDTATNGMGDSRGGAYEIKTVRSSSNGLDLSDVLDELAARKIGRILVEGGPVLARSFLEADLVDRVIIFRSPKVLGEKRVPALAGLPMEMIESNPHYVETARRPIGTDTMTIYDRAT